MNWRDKFKTFVALVVALVCLYPAIALNVDWTGDTPLQLNITAALLIFASALFIEAARRVDSRLMRAVYLIGALMLVVNNSISAFDTISRRDDAIYDGREASIVAAQNSSSLRLELSRRRNEQSLLAGELTPEALEAEVQKLKAQEAKRWRDTSGCKIEKLTAPQSKAFCSRLLDLEAKAASARKRDQLDAEIEKIDAASASIRAPTHSDPTGARWVSFLLMFGITISDEAKNSFSANRGVFKALSAEFVATIGPSASLVLLGGIGPGRGQTRKTKQNKKSPVTRKDVPGPKANSLKQNLEKFIAATLETAPGHRIRVGQVWMRWQKFCSEQGIDPGNNRQFGIELKKILAHDRNGNRPQYLDVRIKSSTGAVAA